MGFKDILKKSFLQSFSTAELSTTTIIISLLLTAVIGFYIYAVYKFVTKKSFYSKSFNISLVALALIVAAVILSIQSSVVISLGMVGALSIVRFRTAVKDPMDLVFLFWSISVGIICGAGLFEVAVIVSVAITFVIVALEMVPVRRESMLLIINAEKGDIEDKITEIISGYTTGYRIKSRNISTAGMDMIIELRVKNGAKLIQEVGEIPGIKKASLLSHDGEVTY